MAARRQHGRLAFRRAAVRRRRAAPCCGSLAAALPIGAATTEYVVVDRNSGLAISGFDPVAYFTDGAAVPRARANSSTGMPARSGGSATRATAPPSSPIRTSICRGSAATIRSGSRRGVPLAGDPRHLADRGASGSICSHTPENKAIFAANARAGGGRGGRGTGRRSSARCRPRSRVSQRDGGRRIAPGDEARNPQAVGVGR